MQAYASWLVAVVEVLASEGPDAALGVIAPGVRGARSRRIPLGPEPISTMEALDLARLLASLDRHEDAWDVISAVCDVVLCAPAGPADGSNRP